MSASAPSSPDVPSAAVEPVAAIDCGTNSIRLLLARPRADGTIEDLDRRMEVVRLGHGVDRTGLLDPAAIARTLEATARYRDLIRAHGVRRVRFVATSATRDAGNRDEFIAGVHALLGITPEVVTGAEEAELSFRGALSTLPGLPAGPRLVVDIGGGSTELVLGEHAPEHRISLDIGSVRLTERHLLDDPPTEAQIAAARADVDRLLDEAETVVPLARTRTVVGVAGTVTTVTAVAEGLTSYDPDATHGVELPLDRTLAECDRLLHASRAERAENPVIHPGRIDVIGAGALIWERVLERVRLRSGVTTSRTSEHDILDGIALSLAFPADEPATGSASRAPESD